MPVTCTTLSITRTAWTKAFQNKKVVTCFRMVTIHGSNVIQFITELLFPVIVRPIRVFMDFNLCRYLELDDSLNEYAPTSRWHKIFEH